VTTSVKYNYDVRLSGGLERKVYGANEVHCRDKSAAFYRDGVLIAYFGDVTWVETNPEEECHLYNKKLEEAYKDGIKWAGGELPPSLR
jgi:hypothetical protein